MQVVYKTEKMFFCKTYTLNEDSIVIEQEDRFGHDFKVEFKLSTFHLPHGESKTFINDFNIPVAIIGVLVFGSAFLFSQTYTDFHRYVMIGLMLAGFGIIGFSGFLRKKTNNAIYYNKDNAYIFEVG